MKPFVDLSNSGQVKRLKRLAQAALLEYDFDRPRLACLDHAENTTFKVEAEFDRSSQTSKITNNYVLRIYRPNKHSIASIHSELLWLLALRRETDLMVSEPVPARNGALFAVAEAQGVPEPRCCALFRWLPGRSLNAGLNARAMERVGIVLARLHQHSQQFVPPEGFVRPRLDEEGLFGASPITLPVESQVFVSPSDRAVLEAAALRIREQMQSIEQKPEFFGLIHSDLHYRNCKFYKGEVQVFDFDDCAWGYYLYDLAVTLYYLRRRNREEFLALRQALLESYQQVNSLPQADESCWEALMAARRLQLLRDVFQRQDNPKLRSLTPKFVESSVEELRKFLHQ